MYEISREIRPNNGNRKKREQRWFTVLKNQAKEFCLGTGLHGYKYIAQSQRTKIERKFKDNMPVEYLVSEMGLLNELLIPGGYGYDVGENLTKLQNIISTNGYTISQVVKEVSPNCSSLLAKCRWKGTWTSCEKLFELSLSRDGVCCSFNYITSNDPRVPPRKRSEHLSACGYQTGLTVVVNVDPNDYLAALLGSYGITVMLHYPYDYPDNNAVGKLVGLNQQVFHSIAPEEFYSTSEVRELAENVRDCVFSDERIVANNIDIKTFNLTYARYSYKNCMAECRATMIKAKCKCVPYYYPQQGTRVCDLKDVKCLKDHISWYETSWPGTSMSGNIVSRTKIDDTKRPCGCMPDCMLYRYLIEDSVGTMDRSKFFDDIKNATVPNESMVHIFFGDLVSIKYRRSAYYNWRNLFASFGGLLGLFVGFSLMSGYELVYFFVIRVIADACKKRRLVLSAENIEKHRVGY